MRWTASFSRSIARSPGCFFFMPFMDCPSLHYTYNCSFSMAIMAMVTECLICSSRGMRPLLSTPMMPMRRPENQACCKGSPSPRTKMRRRTRSLITLRSCWCCCLCVSSSYHCMAVLEYLDFERCKRWLRTKLGAMLRVMPYRPIRKAFERRCLEHGVVLR